MKNNLILNQLLLLAVGFIQSAWASEYHLFNPKPAAKMRDMVADRPDKTEGPYTVDPGHLQIETDIATFTRDTNGADVKNTFGFNIMMLKLGLTESVDFHAVFDSYRLEKNRTEGDWKSSSGFGDTTLRAKVNFFGNGSQGAALGVIPFIKFATSMLESSDKKVEGGVLLPLTVPLPTGWTLGTMMGWGYQAYDGDDEHQHVLIHTISFSHGITGGLSGYVELFSQVGLAPTSAWQGSFDTGLTYLLTENVMLDTGINIGLSSASEDLNPFIGLTSRF